jgi:hypothetical protein
MGNLSKIQCSGLINYRLRFRYCSRNGQHQGWNRHPVVGWVEHSTAHIHACLAMNAWTNSGLVTLGLTRFYSFLIHVLWIR